MPMTRAVRRRLWILCIGFVAMPGLWSIAHAQEKGAKSPAAKLDLSVPQFDTTTSVYDIGRRLEKSANTIVAEVEGRAITLGDVGDAISDLPLYQSSESFEVLYPAIIQHLIRQQAIVVRAQQHDLDSDPTIKRRMKTAALNVLVGEWLLQETAAGVTEKMLLERFEQRFAGRPGPDEVRLRLIQVQTESEAIALINEIKAGADFATVARRASRDQTASAGGDLGYTSRAYLNTEIGTAAFVLRPGQLGEYPVPSNGQWYIVKVEDRRPGATPTFFSLKAVIAAAMRQELVEQVAREALKDVVRHEYTIAGKEPE